MTKKTPTKKPATKKCRRRRFRRFRPVEVQASALVRDEGGKILIEAGLVPNPDPDACEGSQSLAIRVNGKDGAHTTVYVPPYAFIEWSDSLAGAWVGRYR